ncbi:MAG: rRNA pseudouridine synthase [Paludibacteraceae bacterium]|nr:rRNA pseudouridine synthase [Paludibacteraceae bacterium]
MEKNHLKSRSTNDRRKGVNGGYKGRGNASGSISYAEFRRNGGSKARNEMKEKQSNEDFRKPVVRNDFSVGTHAGFGEKPNRFGEKSGRFGENFVHSRENNFAHGRRDDHHNDFRQKRGNDNFRKVDDNKARFGNDKFNSFDKPFDNRERKPKNQTPPTYKKTQFVDYSKPMRLNRFLANAGVCSRREADSYIQAGVVTVNGIVVTELGSRVVPDTDRVLFHNDLVKIERRVYILLNKPKDYVTTAEDVHAKKKVLDLVKGACAERVYPVGRLDRNTTGVLLITNDGELTSKLTHPSFNKKKIYQVTLDHDVTDADVKKITNGIILEDGEIKVDEFSFIKDDDRKNVGVEIHSGRNRIVRRIFESLGYKVMRLDRVYFAGLTKKNLPRGKWRFLSEKEVIFLKMNANNPTENC